MEYMGLVFKGLGEILMDMWSCEFIFLGVRTSVGALVMFSGLSVLVLKLIRG